MQDTAATMELLYLQRIRGLRLCVFIFCALFIGCLCTGIAVAITGPHSVRAAKLTVLIAVVTVMCMLTGVHVHSCMRADYARMAELWRLHGVNVENAGPGGIDRLYALRWREKELQEEARKDCVTAEEIASHK